MNITLSRQQAFELAETFAAVILGHVVERDLWMIGSMDQVNCSQIEEVKAAIRSVSGWERRQLVSDIGWHFRKLRADKHQEVRGIAFYQRCCEVSAELGRELPCVGRLRGADRLVSLALAVAA